MRKLDSPALDEQVIAVPKISLDRVPKRFPRRRTRKADQLVEVPTIISFSSLQSVVSNIDIPVPRVRGGRGGGLPGFRPGQGSPAADVEQIVGIPVPQRRRLRRKCSPPGQGSTAYLEQIAGSCCTWRSSRFSPRTGFFLIESFSWRR